MTIIDKTTPRKTTLGNLTAGDTFIIAPDTDGYIEHSTTEFSLLLKK